MHTPYLIGITGGSASGKTTFLRRLLAAFPEEQICLISQDNYYHPREKQLRDDMGVENFDLPASIDAAAYARDVLRISQGHEVRRQEYTFNNAVATPQELVFRPAPIVVVEGIFVFHFEEIAKLLDLKVYIDAQEHVKLHRRIIRDRDERGYDPVFAPAEGDGRTFAEMSGTEKNQISHRARAVAGLLAFLSLPD